MSDKITKKENKNMCVIDYAFQRINGKYKGRILWRLHIEGTMRYGELKRAIDDISTKMLTQTLRELEEDNLVHRKIYQEVPPKVEYSLTNIGEELIPCFQHLVDWAYKHVDNSNNNYKISEHPCIISYEIEE